MAIKEVNIATIYIDGLKVIKGPYSRDYRGKKVGRKLVKQVPPGYLHFFVEDADGDRVLQCLTKEDFKEKAIFDPNPKGFTDEKEKLSK